MPLHAHPPPPLVLGAGGKHIARCPVPRRGRGRKAFGGSFGGSFWWKLCGSFSTRTLSCLKIDRFSLARHDSLRGDARRSGRVARVALRAWTRQRCAIVSSAASLICSAMPRLRKNARGDATRCGFQHLCIFHTGRCRGGKKASGSRILGDDGTITLSTALKKARAAGGCSDLVATLVASGRDAWAVDGFKGTKALS